MKAVLCGLAALTCVAAVGIAAYKFAPGDGKIYISFEDDGKCHYEIRGTEKQVDEAGNPCDRLLNGDLDWKDVVVKWGDAENAKSDSIQKKLHDKWNEKQQQVAS